MSSSPIHKPSSVLQVSPPTAENTIGSALWYPLGAGPSGFLNWAMVEIPKHIEGIDKKADPFLEHLILLLDRLGTNWKDQSEPDALLLKQVIDELEKFGNYSDKAQLLYPQIMSARPSSTSTTVQEEERKEIHKKKGESQERSEMIYSTQIIPLLQALKERQTPSIQGKTLTSDVLNLIGELSITLKEVAYEQRSILAKMIYTVTSLATQSVKEVWENFSGRKTEDFSVNPHPLMQLLAVLGKYSSGKSYLPGDMRREITKALRDLDTQCPAFLGIYAASHKIDINAQSIHEMITNFIRNKLLNKNSDEIYTQVANFAKSRKEELISQVKLEFKLKYEELFKEENRKLEQEYQKIGEGRFFGKITNDSATRKDTAKQNAEQNLRRIEKQHQSEIEQKTQEINSDPFWVGIDREKTQWGMDLCNNKKKDPKGFFDPTAINEIIWKAVAYQQQKEEWLGFSKAISESKQNDPKTIIQALQLAIEYLQRYSAIEQGLGKEERKESLKKFEGYVLSWMGYAKEQMWSHQKNIWERDNIDKAFDQALTEWRKGNYIISINGIQNFIRKSEYWKDLWAGIHSPLVALTDPFKEFCRISLPPKPPKSAPVVLGLLGHEETRPWEGKFMEEANKIEKEKVLENALDFACFEFVAFLLGIDRDKMAIYKRLVDARDKIKFEVGMSDENLKLTLQAFLGDIKSTREAKHLEALKRCRRRSLGTEDFGKQIYLELVNILVSEYGNSYSPSTWAAWSLFTSVYDLVELFIRPFSERIFNEIDGLFKSSSGRLNEKHLVPIKGVSKALATYKIAMSSWEKEIEKQNQEQGGKRGSGKLLVGTKDDVGILLDRPDRYDGMTPEQITLRMGYALVSQIQFPDYTTSIMAGIEKIKAFAWTERLQNKYLNVPIIAGQWLLASPFRVALFGLYYVVKVITVSMNSLVQVGGKIYLWKTNAVSKVLDKMLDSLLVDVESAPILDTILLEQLEDLLKELEKGTPPENSQTVSGEERNKKVISEAIQHLFEVIEIDKFDTLEAMKKRPQEGIVPDLKTHAYDQLKKLLATVLVNTSKSLLQKEQVDSLLFNLFRIANEGLRGGKVVVLTQEQKFKLAQKKIKEVDQLTEQEITEEGKRITLENIEKIPVVLSKIREIAINPAIDKSIDEQAQTSSQILLDYMSWMQKRLLSPSENGGHTNILQFLTSKLNEYRQSPSDDIIREIHFVYAQFTHEMIAFQTKLDAHPSPNSPEFNQLISDQLVPGLKKLTSDLQEFITNKDINKISVRSFEKIQAKAASELGKIEKAEQNRVMGLQTGMKEFIQEKVTELIQFGKNPIKSFTHKAVHLEIDNKVEELRSMSKNKTLVKHAILWQMRLYLNPELAFKA